MDVLAAVGPAYVNDKIGDQEVESTMSESRSNGSTIRSFLSAARKLKAQCLNQRGYDRETIAHSIWNDCH